MVGVDYACSRAYSFDTKEDAPMIKNLHMLSDKNLKARYDALRAAYKATSRQSDLFKMLAEIKRQKDAR